MTSSAEVQQPPSHRLARPSARHPLQIKRLGGRLATPAAISVTVLMTVVGAAYLALSWNHRAPMVYADEAGTLGNARWLVGAQPWWMGMAGSSTLGYPLLIAPVFAVVHSPVAIYRVLMAVNALLCAILAGLLYLMARKLVLAPPRVALAASLIACTYPAIAVQSGIAWVETTATVAVALFVLTGWWLFQRPGYPAMVAHATVAVYLWFVHGRFLAIPVILLLLLAYFAVRHRALRGPAIVTMAFTLAALLVGHQAQSAVQRARWDPDANPEVTLRQILGSIPTDLTRQLAGQVLYLLIATMGLAALGAMAVARAFLDTRLAGPGQAGTRPRDHWAGAIYALAALGSVVVVASTWVASTGGIDPAGRYADPLAPTLLALGIAVLVTRPQGRANVARGLGIASGAILIVGLMVLATSPTHGDVGKIRWITDPGIRPFFGFDSRSMLHSNVGILVLTAAATASVALLALAARRLRWSLGVVAFCVFLVVAAIDVSKVSRGAANASKGTAAYFAMRAHRPQTVAYDLSHRTVLGYYGMPFWLNESTFVSFRSSAATWPEADMYIGPVNWPLATRHGLHRLLIDPLSNQGVWVR
jgi:hypothetical protein